MSPTNRSNDTLTDAKGNDNFPDTSPSIDTSSSEPFASDSESAAISDGAISKMFNSSPLWTLKKVVKPNVSLLVGGRGHLPTLRRVSELMQDNGQKLSGLMMHCNPSMVDEIDQSFASDFDESARWTKQNR